MGRARRSLADPDGDQTAIDPDLLIELAAAIGRRSSRPRQRTDETAHRLHRADALRRVAGDIGSRLDLDRILSGLVDHAMVLFNGDRGAVFLRARGRPADRRGQPRPVARATSESVVDFPARSLPSRRRRRPPAAVRRPTTATTRAAGDVRAAVVQEGFDTICTAPLLRRRPSSLGLLNVYHDAPHDWTTDELDTMAALADAGRRRDQERPELRADGDLGRPAPVDPAARRAAGRGSATSARSASRSRPSCAS